jgi:hypothetical protein
MAAFFMVHAMSERQGFDEGVTGSPAQIESSPPGA